MKRKPKENRVEEMYKQTDFFKRFSNVITRGMKDHKYAAEF